MKENERMRRSEAYALIKALRAQRPNNTNDQNTQGQANEREREREREREHEVYDECVVGVVNPT